jgi:hypothetical protein
MSDEEYFQALRQANAVEKKNPRKCAQILEDCIHIIDDIPNPSRARLLDKDNLQRRIQKLELKYKTAEELTGEEKDIASKLEKQQADIDAKAKKPRMKALKMTEIDSIWEFYFLHPLDFPKHHEYFGGDSAKEVILRMIQQLKEIYKNLDPNKILIQDLAGDSKFYYIGNMTKSFDDVDRIMRWAQSPIFESQGTEHPLRIVFSGNCLLNHEFDLHNLLYIMTFNLAYPREVILLQGEISETFEKTILEDFDKELLEEFVELCHHLPPAYYVRSTHKSIFNVHSEIFEKVYEDFIKENEVELIVGDKIQDRKVIEVTFPSDPEYEEEYYNDEEPTEEDPEEECDDETSEIECDEEDYEEGEYEESEYEEEEYEEEDETKVRITILDIEQLN